MDALKALLNKRDTRIYRPEVPDWQSLNQVFAAARMAGSAKNFQLTRMVVVTNPETKKALTEGGDFTSWIDQAPVIVAFATPIDGGRLFDVGRMAQNLMVAAHAVGLASCPFTFHHQDVVRKAIQLPDDYEAGMGVSLGWPGPKTDNPLASPRLPLAELVHYEHWREG